MMKLISRLRNLIFFKLSVIYLRYLIGFAFVFASFIKIRGERFTSIPATEPVGYFFEAMYRSGFYWNFLGWSQFMAGSLLMTQRFSTIGAIVFFPIILNVFMITHSIDFGLGTPLITSMMLLGTAFLLLWDYRKWAILFKRDHHIFLDMTQEPPDRFMNDPLWVVTGIVFILLTLVPALTGLHQFVWWAATMLLVGIVAFVIAMVKKSNGKY